MQNDHVNAWDEMWPQLRVGDVYPLPLATHAHRSDEGWVVEVVMVQTLHANGYSSIPIFTHREPYDPELGPIASEAERVTKAATAAFAQRLAAVMDPEPKKPFWLRG